MDRDKWRIQDSARGGSSSSSSSGKPTVNYINITRLPEGGIVNIDIKRQPGSGFTATVDQSPSSSDNFFRTSNLRGSSLPGSITNFDDDFFDNTSSRIRSMLRQHQNKFEDSKFTINPREGNVQTIETNGATVVIKQPPLPVHVQSTGGSSSTGASPYRVVIHHPRSHSSESVVVETSSPGSPTTKHVISPRTGSASNVSMLETKFPSLKAVSPFGQRSFLISSPLFGEGGGSRLSLFDRFNEHAPPAFFESKLRSASNPENIHVSRVTVVRDGTSSGGAMPGRERSKVHNIPIKIEGRDVDPATRTNKSSVIYKIPINLVSKTSTPDQQQQQTSTQQQQQQQHIQVKPNRISIPIITHKKSTTPTSTSTSEAEEKLAALTKQLEDEMRMTGMPGAVPPKTIVATPSTLNKPAAPSPPNVEITSSQVPVKKPQIFDEPEKPDITTPTVLEKSMDILGKDASASAVKSLAAKDKEELKSFGPCNKCTKDVFMADGCKAMGKLYHTSCFYCSICNRSLKGKVFYDVKGTIYCEEDYVKSGYKQLAEVCKACSRLILDVVVQAAGHAYHTGCFKCCQCQHSLLDQNFVVDSKNNLCCVDDYYKINSLECATCKKLIKPAEGSNDVGRIMVMNKSYHVDCLACNDCKKKLGAGNDSGCYPLNEDTILCKMCYNKKKPS